MPELKIQIRLVANKLLYPSVHHGQSVTAFEINRLDQKYLYNFWTLSTLGFHTIIPFWLNNNNQTRSDYLTMQFQKKDLQNYLLLCSFVILYHVLKNPICAG